MASDISSTTGISIPLSTVIKEYILLIVLALLQFTFLLDYAIMMPLGPHIILSLGIKPQGFSYLISAYTFSAAIAGFFASFFIDRFERKKALLFCYICFSLGPLLSSLSTGFWSLFFARVFTGAFGGLVSSLIMTVLGDAVPVQKLGRATGFVLAANAIATIIGIPVAIYISDNFTWQAPFYLLFFLTIILSALIYFVVPVLNNHISTSSKKSKRLFVAIKNPNFIWPLIFMSLLTLAGGFTILPFLSTFMVTNYSFRGEDLSLLFFIGGIGSFMAGPLVGNLTDRFGKQNIFLWLNFFSIIPILALTQYPLGGKTLIFVVVGLFFMLSSARHMSGMALVNSKLNKAIRGKFLSLSSSIQLMAGTLGTLLTGYLLTTEDGYLENFDIIGVIAICATIMCIFTAFLIDD